MTVAVTNASRLLTSRIVVALENGNLQGSLVALFYVLKKSGKAAWATNSSFLLKYSGRRVWNKGSAVKKQALYALEHTGVCLDN
jgi:hypothetical protein